MKTWLDGIRADLRLALRGLRRNPGFTAAAVLTLALGIGSTTAIFSVVNGILMRPLPYPDADRIQRIWDNQLKDGNGGSPYTSVGDDAFLLWREENETLEDLASYTITTRTLYGGEAPERVRVGLTSWNFFQFLGISPLIGRAFASGEDMPGAAVVLLGHAMWTQRFGADPDIIGRTLILNDRTHTVIGVLPPDSQLHLGWVCQTPCDIQIWAPRDFDRSRQGMYHGVIARPKPGATTEAMAADLGPLQNRIHAGHDHPPQWEDEPWRAVTIEPFHQAMVSSARQTLLVLLGAVAFVLLIACANVANMLLTRGSLREREIAVRATLGAGRKRLAQQLLTEVLVLALLGGALGLALAGWGVNTLVAINPGDIPRLNDIGVDGHMLGATITISLLTAILFGIIPALRSSKPNLSNALKDGSRSLFGLLRRNRLRSVLVVGEVALALVLLIGGGLMMNSFLRLLNIDPGFDRENVLAFEVRLPTSQYAVPAGITFFGGSAWQATPRLEAFLTEVHRRVHEIPGVLSASYALHAPLTGRYGGRGGGEEVFAINPVSVDYFRTLDIPLLRGRNFTESDGPGTPRVAVVNQTLARNLWPGDDPLGKELIEPDIYSPSSSADQIRMDTLEVVGIVGDVRQWGLREEAAQGFYIAMKQSVARRSGGGILRVIFLARTTSDPLDIVPAVRTIVTDVDPNIPVYNVNSLEQFVASQVAEARFYTLLLTIFAGVAFLLATIGVYGAIWYSVTQRTHEIGVRVALGASRDDVLRLVVGQGVILTGIGLAVGIAGALALTRLLASQLYEVGATDPATFVATSVLLGGVAIAATFVPARRAASVDPMVALGHE
ncbi:MAG: ABC transporter permease [Gemmatimonadetes bacterium]|nr:ABC transporter permease [Gemmatimonadota bacterium]